MRVSPYQRIRRCSYSSKELMHWPTSSSLFFSFFLGDPVDMVTPRSIYNDVNSPKIGFPYLLGWYQSQKKLTASLYDILSITITDLMKTLPSSSFPRQEIYEAAKLTKAEVITLHRKAIVVDFIERARGSPMIF